MLEDAFLNRGLIMKTIASAIIALAVLCTAAQAVEIRGIGNKCLDVTEGNSADGTPVILYQCKGRGDNANQLLAIR